MPQLNPNREFVVRAIKRAANRRKKDTEVPQPLNVLLNQAAKHLGYLNWSLFHKDVDRMPSDRFELLVERLYEADDVSPYLPIRKSDEEAIEEMRAWVEDHYSPLQDWAFYDNESENGYAAPDVDLDSELQSEFGDRVPLHLIKKVANDMELEQGPWGDESGFYGDFEE